jgi:hypothetical protein
MQITEVSIAAIVDRNKEEAHFKEVKRQNIGLCQSYANRWLKGERWLPILLKHDLLIVQGTHRTVAAILLGHSTIFAEVIPEPKRSPAPGIFPPQKFSKPRYTTIKSEVKTQVPSAQFPPQKHRKSN